MDYFDIDGNLVEKPENMRTEWRPSVYGLYIRDGAVLLCRSRKHDYIEFPGGGLEEGETDIEALFREFEEETSLKILKYQESPFCTVVRYSKFVNGKFYKTILIYYIIEEVEEMSGEQIRDDSIVAVEFVDLDNIPKNIHIAHKEALNKLVKSRG